MSRALSSPKEAMRERYDVVVIGSGYGGGIAASRLARAGRRVCLLERGAEKLPGAYPNGDLDLLSEVQIDTPKLRVGSRTALFDLRYNQDMNVVVGCGLGGTSLINAGICLRPDAKVLAGDGWPSELRSQDVLAPYFDLVEQMLRPAIAPDTYLRVSRGVRETRELSKGRALREAAGRLGESPAPVPVLVNFERFSNDRNHVGVTQYPCVGCGDCVSGCNYHAKNTLIMNYLPDAKSHGAEIFTRASVHSVEPAPHGWDVHGQSLEGSAFSVGAGVVIVAAGTLGSTEILLRSRQRGLPLSEEIGRRFSGNGDTIGFAYNNDQLVNGVGLGSHDPAHRPPIGPCSTVMLDLRGGKPVEDGMVVVDGAVPGAMSGLLAPLLAIDAKLLGEDTSQGLSARVRKACRQLESKVLGVYTGATRNTLFLLLMAHDDSGGHMYLDDDRLRVRWPGLGEQEQFQRASETILRITQALGGTYLANPVWNDLTHHSMVTGHPLGGCAMADDPSTGVVNDAGEVFTGESDGSIHEGLYVMDGSVVPTALGVNPLLTIAALAERSCQQLAHRSGLTINYELS